MPTILPHFSSDPIPDTPVINPFFEYLTRSSNGGLRHECNSDCHDCDFSDARTVLSDCMNNGILASDDLCQNEHSATLSL